jgi:hypothetical protein
LQKIELAKEGSQIFEFTSGRPYQIPLGTGLDILDR